MGKKAKSGIAYAACRDTNVPLLTNTEMEVLACIWGERSNSEIHEEMGISITTVETHRKNIMKKTKSKNVVALVKFCFKHGLFNSKKIISKTNQ